MSSSTIKYAHLEIKSRSVPWTLGQRNVCYIRFMPGFISFHTPIRYRWWFIRDKKSGRPQVHVRCSDRTMTIHVGSYSVRFHRVTDYNKVKECVA
jgi:hypothetical protein